jgi:hypothetical protein
MPGDRLIAPTDSVTDSSDNSGSPPSDLGRVLIN